MEVDRREWASMTTYNKKRIIAALLLTFIVLAGANYCFGWFFPELAKPVAAIGVLAVLVFMTRFAPTREEFEEHRRLQGNGRR